MPWERCTKVNLQLLNVFRFPQLSKTTKLQGMMDSQLSFINFFWPEIGYLLVEFINYSYVHGELSTLQKEAIITLVKKKNRDR